MTALVAAVLLSTPAAPAAPPTGGNPLIPPVLEVTFYFGGYAEGFDAGRNGKLPIPVFT
jgi:hypothetical protein